MMAKSDGGGRLRRMSFRGRISIVLGCVLSFLALVTPFCSVGVFRRGFDFDWTFYKAYFWSFKSSAKLYYSNGRIFPNIYGLSDPIHISLVKNVIEAFSFPSVCFDDYWFDSRANIRDLAGLVIALFALQLSTLTVGVASFFVRRDWVLRFVTIVFGASIIGLMLSFLSSMKPYHILTLQLGFLLAVLAEVVFDVGLAWRIFKQATDHGLSSRERLMGSH